MYHRPIKLLLVEDDPSFAYIVKGCMELTGRYEICHAANGKIGLEYYYERNPDVIVSDIDMPEMSGWDMVKEIRRVDQRIPIFFATGYTSPKDLLTGFELGVDNYIRKPYLPEELNAHIMAVLKRREMRNNDHMLQIIPLGEYWFNVTDRILQWRDQKFSLTHKETNILLMLYQRKGQIVDREEILYENWGEPAYQNSRSLDVFLSKLRKYLEYDPKIEIRTARGAGNSGGGVQLIIKTL